MPVTAPQRLGRVGLVPGVSRSAMRTFYIAALFSTGLMAFMNFVQPFALAELLHVPPGQQGRVSGNLAFLSELVIIACIGFAGALSDRVGRRPIYAAGFLVLAVGYAAYPFASSVGELMVFRAVFAVGAACVAAMLATVLADYPVEADRGKATGAMGIMNGLGIIIMLFGLVKLPHVLTGRGVSAIDAGRITYLLAAGLCVIAAIIVARGLARGRAAGTAHERRALVPLLREGLAAGRDPGVALAYGAAFVSRGDLVVVGTFLTLWVQRHGAAEGLSTTKTLALGGMIAGISQTAAFLWAPVIGHLADRMNRVSALALALALATVGYSSLGLVDDPTGAAMIIGVCVVGVGEISALIASQVLIAQQAPSGTRGSVMGIFGLFGALGILLATKLGGHLFDQVHPSAPFVLMGGLNFVLLGWALAVRRRVRAPARPVAAAIASAPDERDAQMTVVDALGAVAHAQPAAQAQIEAGVPPRDDRDAHAREQRRAEPLDRGARDR